MGMFDFLGQSGQKTESTPWAPQAGYLKEGFNKASDWLDSTKNPNANIQGGWNQQLNQAQSGFGGVTDASQGLNQWFSNPDLLNPETNQYLQANIDSLGENITRQTGRNRNQINQQAVQAGAYGGDRQGVAEGLNAEAATNAFSTGANEMLLDNYNRRMQQMQAQQQFLPQAAQLAMLPGMVQEDVGMAEQNLPMDNLQRFWQIIGGNNWGGTQTTQTQASPLQMLGQFGQAASLFKGA